MLQATTGDRDGATKSLGSHNSKDHKFSSYQILDFKATNLQTKCWPLRLVYQYIFHAWQPDAVLPSYQRNEGIRGKSWSFKFNQGKKKGILKNQEHQGVAIVSF